MVPAVRTTAQPPSLQAGPRSRGDLALRVRVQSFPFIHGSKRAALGRSLRACASPREATALRRFHGHWHETTPHYSSIPKNDAIVGVALMPVLVRTMTVISPALIMPKPISSWYAAPACAHVGSVYSPIWANSFVAR